MAGGGTGWSRWTHIAPCAPPEGATTHDQLFQEHMHRALDGAPFENSEGLMLNGKAIWPGSEPNCFCRSVSIDDDLQPSRH